MIKVLINDIHINIGVTAVCCNIWLSWRDFFHILNNGFYFIVCHFFAVGFSLVAYSSNPPPPPTPPLLPPNSPYNLNTCNKALQHIHVLQCLVNYVHVQTLHCTEICLVIVNPGFPCVTLKVT